MIVAENLVKIYNKKRVVDGINLQVKKGEVVGLLGPNGAGKTTTFYMIVGLIKANLGIVTLNGENISSLPMHKRARKGLGYLPQEPSIFRKLSVEENVLVLWENMPEVPESEYQQRLDSLLQEMGIDHIRHQKGISLSGGERRRVEIMRALACNPDFILLDEPFAGIDPIAVNDIKSIIGALKDKGYGVLITDHNVRETLSITDRAYVMHSGKVLIEGSSEKISNDPEARKLYLGDNFKI